MRHEVPVVVNDSLSFPDLLMVSSQDGVVHITKAKPLEGEQPLNLKCPSVVESYHFL